MAKKKKTPVKRKKAELSEAEMFNKAFEELGDNQQTHSPSPRPQEREE